MLRFICALFLLATGPTAYAETNAKTENKHHALLQSSDPILAQNKRLVYDMYREVLLAGRTDLIPNYISPDYIQHNPNVKNGPDALAAFIRGSRPMREIQPGITLPVISIIAERDIVVISFVRPETGQDGEPYVTSWFDMFRIKDGKIVEHWDPALRTSGALKMDPNKQTLKN